MRSNHYDKRKQISNKPPDLGKIIYPISTNIQTVKGLPKRFKPLLEKNKRSTLNHGAAKRRAINLLCFLSQGPRTKYSSPLAIAIIPSVAVRYLIFCFPANLIRKSIRNRLITVEVIIVIAKPIHPIPAIEGANKWVLGP